MWETRQQRAWVRGQRVGKKGAEVQDVRANLLSKHSWPGWHAVSSQHRDGVSAGCFCLVWDRRGFWRGLILGVGEMVS